MPVVVYKHVVVMEIVYYTCNNAYQVSSPCALPLTSLRSEEVIIEEKCLRLFVVFFIQTCSRHGNEVIHMRTKFYLHVC